MFDISFEREQILHSYVAWSVIYSSIPILLFLLFIVPSPWGKTGKAKFQRFLGPEIPARLAWFLFESPCLFWSSICLLNVKRHLPMANLFILTLFVLHYVHRAIFYPIRMSSQAKPLPLVVVMAGFCYCNINGYLQAQDLCQFRYYANNTFYQPHFIFGLFLFVTGVYINFSSDAQLRALRRNLPVGRYEIPRGGFFDYFQVSAPHFFGEVVEWIGFAILCWPSIAALSFALFSAANLIPRAVAHHNWYQQTFGDEYPMNRKAIFPYLW